MLGGFEEILILMAFWASSAVLLHWAHLPGRWRRGLALVFSGMGLVLLVAALGTEGQRESATVHAVLLGTTAVTEPTSASASLPLYVLTAACLFLGTGGLSVSDRRAEELAERWLATAIVLSVFVTVLRFALEKVAAPLMLSQAVGITWLIPIVGAYFALRLDGQERMRRRLLRALVAYAFATRGVVTALIVAASTLGWGSHYDVSPVVRVRSPVGETTYELVSGSVSQIIVAVIPQLTVWPILTVIGGLCGAGLVVALAVPFRRRGR